MLDVEVMRIIVSARLDVVARELAGLSAEQRALLAVALPSLRSLAAGIAGKGQDSRQ